MNQCGCSHANLQIMLCNKEVEKSDCKAGLRGRPHIKVMVNKFFLIDGQPDHDFF